MILVLVVTTVILAPLAVDFLHLGCKGVRKARFPPPRIGRRKPGSPRGRHGAPL
jgi:hypothetical protein